MPTTRHCGDCQLCCRLLPTDEISKPHGERCPHQKHGVGCAIYHRRPMSCRLWNCRWLVDSSTRDLPRPDRAHYVIDLIPDFVTLRPDDPAEPPVHIEVVQIWVDPNYPHAHRERRLRDWLEAQGKAAIIRYSPRDGFTLFPPSVAGRWVEHESKPEGREHTLEEKAAALGGTLEVDLKEVSENAHYTTTLRVGDQAFPIAAGHADLETARVALANARKIAGERRALIEEGEQ